MHANMQLQACHACCKASWFSGSGFRLQGYKAPGIIGSRVQAYSRVKGSYRIMFQGTCMTTSSCMQSCICKQPTHAASHMQNYMSSCMQTCKEEGCREPCRQNLFLVLNPFRPMPLYSFSVSDFAPKRQLLLQEIAVFWRSQKPRIGRAHGLLCLCLSIKSL